MTTVTLSPKVGALFRLVTGNAGIRGEWIDGGVLVNPLPINQTSKNVLDALIPVQKKLDEVTAPSEPPYSTDGTGAMIINPLYESTKGKPQPKLGFERQFYSLKDLVNILGVCNNLLISDTYSLKNHTNRIINNSVELVSLAQAYNQTIQRIGISIGLSKRVDMTTIAPVNNAANMPNIIATSSSVDEKAFSNLINPISPEYKAGYVNKPAPSFTDIGVPSNNTPPFIESKQYIKDVKSILTLDKLLDSAGIKRISFPTNIILAEINQAAHCEELFKSILPDRFGGESYKLLDTISKVVNLFNVDLLNTTSVQSITNILTNAVAKIRALIARERAIWGENLLKPPIFPDGSVMQIIYQVSRCESLLAMAQSPETQGIIACCSSKLTIEILKDGSNA